MSRIRATAFRPLRLAGCLAAVALGGVALAQSPSGDGGLRPVVVIEINGAIGPASARFLQTSLQKAQERGAEALVLQMNTPGGLATSMRDMITHILSSPVPVIGYVAPPGAHAASAGTYIMYATHVAAMAPGTNLGAATPVQIGGGFPGLPDDKEKDKKEEAKDKDKDGKEAEDAKKSPTGTMEAKAVNDAIAFIQSLAELRGRNAEWAEKAVREAATLTASKAVEMKVVDLVARDLPELLSAADGRTVTLGATERPLRTRGAQVERLEPGFVTNLLAIISNPNVAMILMLIGIYGLIFELANPGSIGPGLIGAICLVLALYALNQLPLNYAGLALILLGIAFMVTEAVTPSFGVFGVAGIAAFVIGSVMLIDTDVPAFRLSWQVIAGSAVASGALLILVLGYVWRSHRRPPVIGPGHLAGREARVLDWMGGDGHVWIEGERWRARGAGRFRRDDEVRVVAMDGLTLVVEPVEARGTRQPVEATVSAGAAASRTRKALKRR